MKGLGEEDWTGGGYPLTRPYVDGAEIHFNDPYWVFEDGEGTRKRIRGPREFRHALSTLMNGLVDQGFVILGVWEETSDEPNPEPGTLEHFKSIAAPYLTFWASFRPYVYAELNLPR